MQLNDPKPDNAGSKGKGEGERGIWFARSPHGLA